MPRIPLRVKAIEGQVARVAGAQPPVADTLPGEFDRDVARRTAVDERRDVLFFEQGGEYRDLCGTARFVLRARESGGRDRRSIARVESAGRVFAADADRRDDPQVD